MAKAKGKALKEAPRQLSLTELMAEYRIEYTLDTAVPLSSIIEPKDAPMPSKKFMAKLKQYRQIIEPLLLQKERGGRFSVISGRRRYRGAKECEIETVPGLITDLPEDVRAVLAMRLNAEREKNTESDATSIKTLLRNGYTEEEIQRESSLSPQEIKQRRRFDHCDGRIRQAILDDVCTVKVGDAAAKLPPGQQKKLMDRFKASGDEKLTMAHVQAAKSADIEAARAALPQELFINPPGVVAAPSYTPDCAWLANPRTRLLWETLLELERSGALELKNTKQSRRAVEDARHVMDNIRQTEAASNGGSHGSVE